MELIVSGKDIKELRELKGITQSQMVAELQALGFKIDKGTYSKMENEIVNPTDKCMKSILTLLQHRNSSENDLDDKILVVNPKSLKTANNDVIDFIPFGKKNSISRFDLVRLTGLTDREVRRAIEQARKEGAFIINDEDGGGYYISEDVQQVKGQYMRDTARAMAILQRRKHMRNFLILKGETV